MENKKRKASKNAAVPEPVSRTGEKQALSTPEKAAATASIRTRRDEPYFSSADGPSSKINTASEIKCRRSELPKTCRKSRA